MVGRDRKMEEEEEEPIPVILTAVGEATPSVDAVSLTTGASGDPQQLAGEVLIAGSSLIICDDPFRQDEEDEDAEISRMMMRPHGGRAVQVVFQPIQNEADTQSEQTDSNTPQVGLAESDTPEVGLAVIDSPQNELAVISGIPQIEVEGSSLPNRDPAESDTPQTELAESDRPHTEFAESDLAEEKELSGASQPLQLDLRASFRQEEYEPTGSGLSEECAQFGSGRPERHVHIRESVEIHEASDSSR